MMHMQTFVHTCTHVHIKDCTVIHTFSVLLQPHVVVTDTEYFLSAHMEGDIPLSKHIVIGNIQMMDQSLSLMSESSLGLILNNIAKTMKKQMTIITLKYN